MAGLPYLPKSLLDESSTWDFASTTQNALSSLQQAGSRLMQPVGQQLADVVRSSLPSPAPAPQPQQPAIPAMPSFKLPSLESWGMGPAPAQPRPAPPEPIDMGPQAPAAPQTPSAPAQGLSAAAGPGAGSFLGFSLPSLADWGIGMGRPGPMAGAGAAGSPSGAPGPGQPSPTRTAGPTRPGDIEAYIRQSAAARGIDPNVAVKVVQAEGGLSDPVRQSDVVYQGQREQSYGPLQLNVTGGVGSAALKAGIDPRNPDQWRQAVDFGLDEVARSGWGQWHGAARVGVGPREGIGGPRAASPSVSSAAATGGMPAPSAVAPPASAAPRPGTYAPEALVPNQITEGAAQGLTAEEALAVCGPAAAVAFARANGRNPTLGEAKQLAQSTGVWDASTGMHGPASEVQLLQKMGVQARLQEGADWTRVAQEVQAGKPVIIDTPQHYFVASGFDPQTGEFEFGQSAGVLRAAKGRTRFRPQDLPSLNMGSPRATIFLAGGD